MSHRLTDSLLAWCARLAAAVAGAIVVLIFAFVCVESWPAIWNVGTRFVSDDSWHPTADAPIGTFQISPMVVGSLVVAATAVLIAVPLGICSAIFCHEYAPAWLAAWYRRVVELLASIPSVVYGVWGLVVLVPILLRFINSSRQWLDELSNVWPAFAPLAESWHSPGTSMLAAVIVLSIMILPMMALVADGAIAMIPNDERRAAAALGLSRWATIVGVVLPAVRSGLLAGVLLTLGRALGETMAVLLVCGNVARMPPTLFGPTRTLTTNIAVEMAYAMGDHRSALFASGLALLLLVAMLIIASDWIRSVSWRKSGKRAEMA